MLDFRLGALEIAARLQTELKRGEHALLVEEPTGEGNAGDDIVLIVLGLPDIEKHTGGIQVVFLEGFGGVGEVELSFAAGCIDVQRLIVGIASGKLLRQSDAKDAVIHIGCMKAEITLTNQDLLDMGQLVEIIIDALDHDHHLTTLVDGQGLILYTLGSDFDLRQLTDLREHRIVGSDRFALYGGNLQLWIEGGEEGGYEVVEAIEDAEGDDESHRGNSYTNDRDAADDIDSVG